MAASSATGGHGPKWCGRRTGRDSTRARKKEHGSKWRSPGCKLRGDSCGAGGVERGKRGAPGPQCSREERGSPAHCAPDTTQAPLSAPSPSPALELGTWYSRPPGRSLPLAGGGKTAGPAHRSWAGRAPRRAAACPGAACLRTAPSRPERAAPAAAEALRWVAG